MVIETGLGGRLDATNILTPNVSVITNISLDHQDLLGDTIEKIAFEKAGIIKQQTPVVIGEQTPTTNAIFEHISSNLAAPIYFCEDTPSTFDELPLTGYQKKNFQMAIVALNQIGLECSKEIQQAALKNLYQNTGYFGRLQTIRQKPKIIIDVSHNPAGVQHTLPIIEQECRGQLFIIYGASKDKDALEILKLFPKQAKVSACLFSNPRSKNREEWAATGIATIYDHIDTAINTIQEQMQTQDLLWVTGSFFLISDLSTEKKIF
jgi:dihydrofolate synthase/folylpolyglutamate synthase